MSWVGAVRFKISKLDELGYVSFGILKLGDESFRIPENELGELGGVSFRILELGDTSFLM